MNVVSLCSGVGLLDLGLEWAGYRTVQFCELDGPAATAAVINAGPKPNESDARWRARARSEGRHADYIQRVLAERFPGIPVHPDAWTIHPEPCDVVAAGFPCQPFSLAGRGLGADDPRHLWPAVIRAIRLSGPRYVILENVPGLVQRGLADVLGDLAEAGFDAEWTCFGAIDVGAPHRRERVWIVATSDPDRSRVWDERGGFFRQGWGTTALAWRNGQTRTVAHPDSLREPQPSLRHPERQEPGRARYSGAVCRDEAIADAINAGYPELVADLVADADRDRREQGLQRAAGRDERPGTRDPEWSGASGDVPDPHSAERRSQEPGRDEPDWCDAGQEETAGRPSGSCRIGSSG